MSREPNLLFARAKLLGNEDLDSLGVSGMFEVVDGTHAPATGRYYVLNICSASETPAARPAAQIAWAAADGVMSVRVRASTSWSSWTEVGAAVEATAIATVFDHTLFDVESGNDAVLAAIATGLTANPPTTVQHVIDILTFYAVTEFGALNSQAAYNYAGTPVAVNLNHVTNPQTVVATGYTLGITTDGAGANAHNMALAASTIGPLQQIELQFTFNFAGETIVIKPLGASSGLMDGTNADASITSITIANAANKAMALEWVGRVKKWRLLDYTFGSAVIV